jgi:hypothetical protein
MKEKAKLCECGTCKYFSETTIDLPIMTKIYIGLCGQSKSCVIAVDPLAFRSCKYHALASWVQKRQKAKKKEG